MKKALLVSIALAVLFSCGENGSGPRVPQPIPEYIPTPEPSYTAKGTRLRTRCQGTTKVIWFADGRGGEYTERTPNSSDCGWTPRPDVSLDEAEADYFNPAVFTVTAEDFDYDIPVGRVVKTETGLEVYSDGRLGDHTVTVAGEEFRIRFSEMPVCETQPLDGSRSHRMDCTGVVQTGTTDDFIYYGEDDTNIVEWEVAYVGHARGELGTLVPAPAQLRNKAQSNVAYINRAFAKSRIYVRLKLVQVVGTPSPDGAFDDRAFIESGQLARTDLLLIDGASNPGTCGFAGMSSSFRDRGRPLRALAQCGALSLTHEVGHTVGLGHGQNGGVQPSAGATFPYFARGGDICGRGDIMQYGAGNDTFSNHKMTCKELFGAGYSDTEMAGYLDTTSTAYAINRVRYDVALVHDEFRALPEERVAVNCPTASDSSGVRRDCYGHVRLGGTLLDYGPDDKAIAVVELGLARNGGTYGEDMPPTHPDVIQFRRWVMEMNKINANSGVYIEFVPTAAKWAGPKCYGKGGVPRSLFKGLADVVVGWCPGDNQGEAQIQRGFIPGQTPPSLQATGNISNVIHELGHVLGMGHGVWGRPEWRYGDGSPYERGAFFPEFGHGWSGRKLGEGVCNMVDSIMSYGNSRLGWSNSLLPCTPDAKTGAFGDARGSRTSGSDEAYHLNRVRWSASRVSA